MEKAHSRIKWENYPSIATPLNETNLNKMDIALDEVDNRVLGLDTAKLDKAVANTMVKDIAFNEKTGIFTITLLDGTTKTIDTKLEKVATNFSYDYKTQKLVLTLVDGTEQEIDMSTLISQYEFADTSTIGFTVGNEGKITATVKDGSVTEDKLQPNFLADIKVEVAKGKSYSDSSYENATASLNASKEAKQYRDEAEVFRNQTQAMSGVEIATTEKAGLVKPDGTTITVDADGTIHSLGGQGTVDYTELENKPSINGTELNGNKTLNDLGIASATELAKTNTKVDTIIDKADLGIKETATGEEIHLTDSAEGKAVEFALFGKARQNTTSGKNLCPDISGTYTTYTGEKAIDLPAGTYTISLDISSTDTDNGESYLSLSDANGNSLVTNASLFYIPRNATLSRRTLTFTISGNAKKMIIYAARSYNASSGDTLVIDKVQIESGTVVTDFDEYSGGMASPNPQYPQPIKVSGESGSVVVKSIGKNLVEEFTNDAFKNRFGTVLYVKADLKPSTRYKLSFNDVVGNTYYLNEKLTEELTVFTTSEITSVTFTTKDILDTKQNSSDKGLYFLKNYIDQPSVPNFSEVMLCEECIAELTDDSYEPYKETLSTIPTENGLAGIKVSNNGNYTDQNGQQWICDEIVKYADGSGKHIQRIGNLKLTSNNATRVFSNHISGNGIAFDNLLDSAYSGAVGISDYDTLTNSFANQGFLLGSSDSANKTIYWCGIVDRLGLTTVEGFKTWLGDRVIKIYYILATPIETPLTAEELAEIEKLHTFYPITNISNDFDCGMSVTYVGEGIITTNTEIPIVAQDGELESGDNVTTLFGKIKRKLEGIGKGVVEVVDNLLSTSTDLPLSANQGRVLDEKITQTNESLADKESTLNGRINDVNENLTQKETALYNEINTLSENIDSQVNALDERITELSESATSGSLTSRTIMVQDFFETVPSTVDTAFGYHQASICGNIVMVNMHIRGITGTTKIGNVKDEYKSILSSSYIPVCVTSQQNKYTCACTIGSSGDVYISTNGATITNSDTLMITGAYICKGKTE